MLPADLIYFSQLAQFVDYRLMQQQTEALLFTYWWDSANSFMYSTSAFTPSTGIAL